MNTLSPLMKVLVVDNQPLIVQALCEFLECSGYRCVPCHSSPEALEAFKRDTEIGLVLCDLHMPEMDGIELTQALQRFSGKHRVFESILLTGQADKQDVIKALRIGIADYYQKPVDLNELLEGIERQQAVLKERMKTEQLGHLNQKLQFLADSIDELYQGLESASRLPQQDTPLPDANRADEDAEHAMPAIFQQLSPRQLDVAKLVGKGQTNYQIACDLGITENTVKLYVSQVLRLTHMNNRTQLALALLQMPSRNSIASPRINIKVGRP